MGGVRLNKSIVALILTIVCLAHPAGGAEKKASRPATPSANIPPEVFRLIEAKEDQVKETATELKIEVSDDILDFFDALIAKTFIEQNTNAAVFIDQSYPLHWMYPHLQPFGPLLKFSRAPLPSLAEDVLRKDADYWRPRVDRLLGAWLKPGASTLDVCRFASRVFGERDLTDFKGDPTYVKSDYTARAMARLRMSISPISSGNFAPPPIRWRERMPSAVLQGPQPAEEKFLPWHLHAMGCRV